MVKINQISAVEEFEEGGSESSHPPGLRRTGDDDAGLETELSEQRSEK